MNSAVSFKFFRTPRASFLPKTDNFRLEKRYQQTSTSRPQESQARHTDTQSRPQEDRSQEVQIRPPQSRPQDRQQQSMEVRGDRRPMRRRGDDDMDFFDTPFSTLLTPFERSFFGPFSSMFSNLDRMGRAFDQGRFGGLARRGDSEMEWSPRADISETKDSFLVTAELPGVPKENIKIDIADDVLTIKGEKKSEHESKDESGRMYRRERSFGSFTRRFALPENVDPKAVKANFENGVLKVNVPKKNPAEDKVEVKID
jgi:HSP20 family protein